MATRFFLRSFYYDSEEFSLPVRLGLINSQGDQDLIVYTLGLGQRYKVYRTNVTIIMKGG